MSLTQTAGGVSSRHNGSLLRNLAGDDWSEIEAVLASPKPLCGDEQRSQRLASVHPIFTVVLAAGLYAAVPWSAVERECVGAGGCPDRASSVTARLDASRHDGFVATAAEAEPEAHIAEGRSSAADALPTGMGSGAARAPMSKQVSLAGDAAADTDGPAVMASHRPWHHRHHPHRAWR